VEFPTLYLSSYGTGSAAEVDCYTAREKAVHSRGEGRRRKSLHPSSGRGVIYEIRSARRRGRVGRSSGLEVVAAVAVANVELVPDEREQHGMRAIEQLAVFNRLEVQFRQDVRRAPSVPAQAVPGFRRKAGRVAHDWEYTMHALQ